MNMVEIKKMALAHLLSPGSLKKIDLVRLIQHSEGYQECFGTPAVSGCGQTDCLWREDCRKQQAQ
ncbi:SAP domain-containing protein [Geobacter sp. SVR]|uniref:SAP domain-containing protein n=1 Tax=Geobacter sp. SVR TaxID=2495594 RepID=UPI00143EFC95|nr:SAP domain-containing protein [Geobacter sp. SVR]BCS53968.1 SAP domain-containing protein [Geobacter sp. SVR]GCF86251.1 SAP domain-containing protein [Geobacter sp. SVR]